jgi:hypothetical protein
MNASTGLRHSKDNKRQKTTAASSLFFAARGTGASSGGGTSLEIALQASRTSSQKTRSSFLRSGSSGNSSSASSSLCTKNVASFSHVVFQSTGSRGGVGGNSQLSEMASRSNMSLSMMRNKSSSTFGVASRGHAAHGSTRRPGGSKPNKPSTAGAPLTNSSLWSRAVGGGGFNKQRR